MGKEFGMKICNVCKWYNGLHRTFMGSYRKTFRIMHTFDTNSKCTHSTKYQIYLKKNQDYENYLLHLDN